jgi:hypothetical protein
MIRSFKRLIVFGLILIVAIAATGCGTTHKGVKPGGELKKKSKCKCKNNKGGIYSIFNHNSKP